MLPGLIDAHVHVKAWHADLGIVPRRPASYTALKAAGLLAAMLHRGFTTVRDAGGADAGLAAAVADGTIPGPRLFFCGHAISQTGGHGDAREAGDDRHAGGGEGLSRIADGVDAVRLAARDELRRGAHFLKVMVSGGISSPTDRLGLAAVLPGRAGRVRRGGHQRRPVRHRPRVHGRERDPGRPGRLPLRRARQPHRRARPPG